MPRCFVGCFLSAKSARALAQRCPDMAGARRVPRENFHVTLLFAGQLDTDSAKRLARLAGGLDRQSLRVPVQRIGGFPGAGRSRILAAELAPNPTLSGWHERLQRGWPVVDEKPFRAHVTLARARGAQQFAELLAPDIKLTLEAPALYESQTHPDGARYRPLTD